MNFGKLEIALVVLLVVSVIINIVLGVKLSEHGTSRSGGAPSLGYGAATALEDKMKSLDQTEASKLHSVAASAFLRYLDLSTHLPSFDRTMAQRSAQIPASSSRKKDILTYNGIIKEVLMLAIAESNGLVRGSYNEGSQNALPLMASSSYAYQRSDGTSVADVRLEDIRDGGELTTLQGINVIVKMMFPQGITVAEAEKENKLAKFFPHSRLEQVLLVRVEGEGTDIPLGNGPKEPAEKKKKREGIYAELLNAAWEVIKFYIKRCSVEHKETITVDILLKHVAKSSEYKHTATFSTLISPTAIGLHMEEIVATFVWLFCNGMV